MLQVVKPVAKVLVSCVDDVILKYKVRGEFASTVLQLVCEEYMNCAGKNMGKKPNCMMRRLELPLENEKKANAVFHWFFEVVRP
ncbi:hypothetical protein HPB50_016799 [Hyalomma asiaticum]|uniref:Uncharacterized protein n=1 Tax=Hyalomma asiaticum TaxID=266040 RepID=A0ACB7SHU5_HYAAI|nr:hypothetical protein HPB50_016799 [Hyalomma asiaticum]